MGVGVGVRVGVRVWVRVRIMLGLRQDERGGLSLALPAGLELPPNGLPLKPPPMPKPG